MKILYYFEEKNTLMDQWQRSHIINELSQYDIEVEVHNPLNFINIDIANEDLIQKLKTHQYDLFMSVHNENVLFIETLRCIKKLKVPTLLICWDNLVAPFIHKKICKEFDLVWLTSLETEDMFKKWGATTIMMPYAANPNLFADNGNREEINRVCFVGTPYGSRVNTLNLLTDNNIYIDLYSAETKLNADLVKVSKLTHLKSLLNLIKFKYGRKVISGAIKNKLLRKAQIDKESHFINFYKPVKVDQLGSVYNKYSLSLSSTAVRNTGVLKKPLEIINLRSFEIPMAGGIQICKYNEELSTYFEDKKEIIFYKDDEDFVNKVKYYLSPENSHIRQKIKKSARLRAVKDHSWHARFQLIFDYFKLV